MTEISHALFVDLTKPENQKEFAVSDLSKKLIEWVGLDVIRFRRNQQVAYRIVDHCRETYDEINGVIDTINEGPGEEADYDKFTKYTDAVDALEDYLFKFVLTSELEAPHYFAKTDTVHDCISGAALWFKNREALRDAATTFTGEAKFLAMFNDTNKGTEMATGFGEAAEDDDRAFYLDLNNAINEHSLADDTSQAHLALNSIVKALVQETVEAIGTLGGAIEGDSEKLRKEKRKEISIQFLFILHGIMEIVVGTSDPDWQAHLKSAAVWTVAKFLAEHLNKPENDEFNKWADWDAAYAAFLKVISETPGGVAPRNWLDLIKLSAKIHRPYLSRAWAVVTLSKNLVNFFNDHGNTLLRNVEPLEQTFDRAIAVLELASSSCQATEKYNLDTYDAQPVVKDFADLEAEIHERYKMLQADAEWSKANDLLTAAVAKDKARIQLMNDRLDKIMNAEDTTKEDELIKVTITSTAAGIEPTDMKVSRTTTLSAIRYILSRQLPDGPARKKIVTDGRFENHTVDMHIEPLCNGTKSCSLTFLV